MFQTLMIGPFGASNAAANSLVPQFAAIAVGVAKRPQPATPATEFRRNFASN